MLAIKIDHLTKKFHETTAVDSLSLEIERGQIVGVIGPDGAGKTTLLRLLTGLYKPTSGSIRIGELDLATNVSRIKDHIGYMPQHFSLYGDLTVAENLRFFSDLYGVVSQRFESRKSELLRFSGLGPFEDRLARNLSGGMQKKLALACNLFHTPDILFLDEPTTGVDPVSRRELWQLLFELNAQGVTLVLTTPYMDEASKCHRVALLYEGGLLAYETPKDLILETKDEIYELLADREAARLALRDLQFLKGVNPFGDALHLVVETGGFRAGDVSRALEDHGIALRSLKRIQPSIEDVFLSLIQMRRLETKKGDVQHRSQ